MVRLSLAEFADKINQIMPVLFKEFARRQANELYKGKITLPQFLILDFLYRQGEAKMTDMAHFMNVTTAAMTGIVDRLFGYTYVIRTHDSGDRRIIRITLTSKGRELVKKIHRQRRQMIMNIFGKLSQTEREEYLSILMHINNILTKKKE